jgi:hypothetical protein
MSKRGHWNRWGRGSCEGWSLEIGRAYRGCVVKRQVTDEAPTWEASINTTALGNCPNREDAMRRVEECLEGDMRLVLHDWALYVAARGNIDGRIVD